MSKKAQRDAERQRKEEDARKCKHCERPFTEGFSYWDANDPFIQKFQVERKLKIGELISCPLCKSLWFKHFGPRQEKEEFVSLDFVPEVSFPLLEDWNSQISLPNIEQSEVLKQIGATPPDAYSNGSDYIRFPCKCILEDGQEIDFCILQFQKKPPGLGVPVSSPPIYINQVKKILPSEYTLSPQVRYATTQAFEIRMGYAPTGVLLPTGGKWKFNWTQNFFATEKVKGKDITKAIESYDIEYADESETGAFIPYQETIIYADWDDKYLRMEITGEVK